MHQCLTWLSPVWLGLLSPLEFFVTIDHSAMWQKHVAWAKPKGSELMTYITARYSTNMVLLSLLLAAEINVFFSSSTELAELRNSLRHDPPGRTLTFWIGIVMLLDICITLLGLVTTFTLWGMISAISPANAHCLLRSTIGQYVISLPPRLLVASLYLFWTWILLFVLDMVVSPISWIFVGVVGILFVSIVIPLSVFGRLVLHAGAMSSKPILETDLEMQLLPSGLQASLWMRARNQQRRDTEAMSQYRYQRTSIEESSTVEPSATATPPVTAGADDNISNNVRQVEEGCAARGGGGSAAAGNYFEDGDNRKPSVLARQKSMKNPASRHHRRLSSNVLPPASKLNSSITRKDLQDLLSSLVSCQEEARSFGGRGEAAVDGQGEVPSNSNLQDLGGIGLNSSSNNIPVTPTICNSPFPRIRHHPHRRGQSSRIVMEWVEDQDVRDFYGAAPAAALPDEELQRSGLFDYFQPPSSPDNNETQIAAKDEVPPSTKDLLSIPLLSEDGESLEEASIPNAHRSYQWRKQQNPLQTPKPFI